MRNRAFRFFGVSLPARLSKVLLFDVGFGDSKILPGVWICDGWDIARCGKGTLSFWSVGMEDWCESGG